MAYTFTDPFTYPNGNLQDHPPWAYFFPGGGCATLIGSISANQFAATVDTTPGHWSALYLSDAPLSRIWDMSLKYNGLSVGLAGKWGFGLLMASDATPTFFTCAGFLGDFPPAHGAVQPSIQQTGIGPCGVGGTLLGGAISPGDVVRLVTSAVGANDIKFDVYKNTIFVASVTVSLASNVGGVPCIFCGSYGVDIPAGTMLVDDFTVLDLTPDPAPPVPPIQILTGSSYYAHKTCQEINDDLAQRLEDPGKVFWKSQELCLYINEAFRTFGHLSSFWRNRGTFPTVANTAFYDLPTQLPTLLGYTVTDRSLIEIMQYHLLEAATSQSVWNGTDMFNMAEVAAAIQRRRDQFLADTGVVLTNFLLNIVPPPSGRVTLPDSVIDVRRAAWLGSAPLDYYTHMWRDDEFALTAGDPTWSISPGTPNAYSVMAPPPIRMQLSPAPQDSGLLDMVTVNAGNALTPATIESLLGIPDNTAWIVKWGALADLLGRDGQGRDPVRAAYCEMRYRQGVELTRLLPVIVHAELNGVPSIPGSLASHDMGSPNWQNITGAPEEILVAGNNLIALANVPDDVYSVTLDVVASRPTGLCVCPTSAGFLQLG